MEKLGEKVAVVTGAGRGLGRAISLAFAHEGADLILLDICKDQADVPYPLSNRKQLEETALRCRRIGSRVVTAPADVRSQAQLDQAIGQGYAEFGQIDILVNNAGLLGPAGRLAHELEEEHWLLMMDVNLNGAWRCCKAVLPYMIPRRVGSIITIASTAGLIGFELFANYVASKHGVVGLTKALALEYGRYNIRVNAICPSTLQPDDKLETEGTESVAKAIGSTLEDYETSSRSYHPLQTLIQAEDVALTAVWLASDDAARLTGTAIPVDAGFTAR